MTVNDKKVELFTLNYLGILPMSEEAYMADLSVAWARLAAYYYRDKPLQSAARHVKRKNATRQRMIANRQAPESESEEEPPRPPQNASETPR